MLAGPIVDRLAGVKNAGHITLDSVMNILACRNQNKGSAAVDKIRQNLTHEDVRFLPLDLSDLASVKPFAYQVNQDYSRLDLLINNTGVMIPPL